MTPRKTDLISRRSFLGVLGSFAAAAPFSLWPLRAQAFFNTGAFMKKRRGNGQTSNGYTIGQSLRFNGTNAYLSRTLSSAGNRQTWTFSAWVKRSAIGAAGGLMASGTAGGGQIQGTIMFNSTDTLEFYDYTGSAYNFQLRTNALFRDPSAWYHVVGVYDSNNTTQNDRARLYVNGQRISGTDLGVNTCPTVAGTSTASWNTSLTHYVGATQSASVMLGGYMAEIYFIDGSALDASSFGQTDTITGQWIPKKYAGTYGTNGFYLPFSNNSAADGSGTKAGSTLAGLGADFSGNNNHWQGGAVLISGATGTAIGTMVQNGGLTAAFDGTTGSPWAVDGSGSNPKWIGKDWGSGTTKVVTKFTWDGRSNGTYLGGATIKLQGSTDNFSSSVVDLYTGAITGTDNETITGTSSSTTGYRYHRVAFFSGAQVNTAEMQFFEAGIQASDQVLDSPTNNFCALNPLSDSGSGSSTLSSGNLQWSSTNPTTWRSGSLVLTSGKWYWEANLTSGNSGERPFIGVRDEYNTSVSRIFRTGTGEKYRNGVLSTFGSAAPFGSTVQVALDADNGSIWFGVDNTWQALGSPITGANPAFSDLSGIACTIATNKDGASNAATVTYNFGQGGQIGLTYDSASGGRFKYTPPAGFKALCAANLPTPAIKNPGQYFNALTWSGNDTSPRTLTGLGFQPDLVWAKNRTSGTVGHRIWDSARAGGLQLMSHSTGGEVAAASDSNGGISAAASDGFTLVGGTSDKTAVNTSSNNYVGWSWKKGATPGFDIQLVSKGSTSGITQGHSLGAAPKLIIGKRRDNGGGVWVIYHASLGKDKYLCFDASGAYSSANYWGSSAPDGSNFTFNDSSTGSFVFYLWSDVTGFSKFGSYTGNASSDGAFVYCGFKPRWVLLKKTTTLTTYNNWLLHDAARRPSNPAWGVIYPELANNEDSDSTNHNVDFLSNGFKIRAAHSNINGSGDTYIFAAFAEAPFKYAVAR